MVLVCNYQGCSTPIHLRCEQVWTFCNEPFEGLPGSGPPERPLPWNTARLLPQHRRRTWQRRHHWVAFSGGNQAEKQAEVTCPSEELVSDQSSSSAPARRRRQWERRQVTRQAKCKPWPGLAEAAKYAKNDVVLLDERARSDVELLARGLTRLDCKAREDVAFLSTKVKDRATQLDDQAKKDLKRLRHLALGLEESASTAAVEHWNDGALDADLKLADLRARRRVMEDTYAALESLKTIHNALVNIVRIRDSELAASEKEQRRRPGSSLRPSTKMDTSSEWRFRVEEAYWGMAASISEAAVGEGEYADTEELEFIVAALLDMDEVAGASGASLITQASNSPDPQTRRAVADALSAAPSLWQLGNAGMGALERLSRDKNKAVAETAAIALEEIKEQWRAEEEKQRNSGLFFSGLPLDKLKSPEEDNKDDEPPNDLKGS